MAVFKKLLIQQYLVISANFPLKAKIPSKILALDSHDNANQGRNQIHSFGAVRYQTLVEIWLQGRISVP
jgi:hypothetical protein